MCPNLAMLTVSPSSVYFGLFRPTTTAVVGPEASPTRIRTAAPSGLSRCTGVAAAAATHAAAKRAILAAWSTWARSHDIRSSFAVVIVLLTRFRNSVSCSSFLHVRSDSPHHLYMIEFSPKF